MAVDPSNLGEPVYKRDQIITAKDLKDIMYGFSVQYEQTRWWQFRLRRDLLNAVFAIRAVENWLASGKPTTTTGDR
jgi:hypothetical protein